MARLGHFKGRIFDRVLLGFHDKPALIAIGGKALNDGVEIQTAIAGYGKGAFDHRVQKAVPAAIQPGDHIPAYIFGMHMVDAGMVRVDHPQNISAGKSHMPGVKKQGQGGAGMGHQKI